MPASEREITAVSHARIFTNEFGQSGGALPIVKPGETFRTGGSGASEVPPIKAGYPSKEECFHEDTRMVKAFGEGDRFLSKFGADPEITADDVVGKIPPHDPEYLWGLSDTFAKRVRPAKYRTDFGIGVASPRDIGCAQWSERIEFEGVSLGRWFECIEQLEPLLKMTGCLDVSESVSRT